jgi:hypothetical protein
MEWRQQPRLPLLGCQNVCREGGLRQTGVRRDGTRTLFVTSVDAKEGELSRLVETSGVLGPEACPETHIPYT